MIDVSQTVEQVAREAYGKLLASLAARHGDVVACEDALSHAFLAALSTWPTRGVPQAPAAWLRTAALNRLRDGHRRSQRQAALAHALSSIADDEPSLSEPDHRLALMFACAHPAVDATVRSALMLQVVLGLDAATVARAFGLSPAAMNKRLVRAKHKLRVAGVGLQLPDPGSHPRRLPPVLDAIYAAYGRCWDLSCTVDPTVTSLKLEALYLAELVARALPHEGEAQGLHALLLFCEARAPARSCEGRYVPLERQATALWNRAMIDAAARVLARAAASPRPGRYQLEAAIQACHVHRRLTGADTREAIHLLYAGLVREAPSLGAQLGLCASEAELHGPAAALARLDALGVSEGSQHQPYWVVRAELARRTGDHEGAQRALERARALTAEPSVRTWLATRAASLSIPPRACEE